ncbi:MULTISPECIES: bifunctional hydroxymethylpyrimidine kinase/phosphomethylpyrimidine kinase [Clostridium]|uniref:bifunctional hydroxymethylpyrimidine kinase/phosphomethylpyrimidine kinase n=1 Tax=Clostridium TaxID=1485 RepID=UPI00069FC100|nr:MULTISPECIES: bifunctional hydroxymethylpyrimidine kinase/phosphomethylpyrimidine kinase [Clostridium]KOF56745.1 phosphomethylpyrimidine kinase [Clostridium sp. DMHC 10]MCD2346670.1 bifunctional hydroxymethylpyrimidine kinase/phosphomethylpyrimidine kinase [Clostridium guangxiense]
MKKVLTIAGSDSSGGAGIQADLKTFSAHGVFGMSVIAAVTAQNTKEVIDVQNISPDIIGKQIDAIFDDIEVDAIKIGMISEIEGIKVVSERLRKYKPQNVVLDPVMVSKSGYSLMNPNSVETLIKELIPIVSVVTPNIPEAEIIASIKIKTMGDMEKAAKIMYNMGPKNVLVKGGHLTGDATDVLYDGKEFVYLENQRINTKNTHGTGCTLSSSIASNLALGMNIKEAVKNAKKYITTAIEHSLAIGHGSGPTNHFYELYKKAGLNYE